MHHGGLRVASHPHPLQRVGVLPFITTIPYQQVSGLREIPKIPCFSARATGLEPATTGSTVRYSNQLSYVPSVSSNISVAIAGSKSPARSFSGAPRQCLRQPCGQWRFVLADAQPVGDLGAFFAGCVGRQDRQRKADALRDLLPQLDDLDPKTGELLDRLAIENCRLETASAKELKFRALREQRVNLALDHRIARYSAAYPIANDQHLLWLDNQHLSS